MAPIPNENWAELMQLTYNNQTLYFAEQFSPDGTLIPICRRIMAIFRANPNMRDWNLALWWTNPTGWLSGCCPRQLYLEDQDAVIRAAENSIAQDA